MGKILETVKSVCPVWLVRWYCPRKALANEFQLTRFLILWVLGLCYAMAFLSFLHQGPGLIGEQGILPVERHVAAVMENGAEPSEAFWRMPSVFWFWHSDTALQAVAWIGLLISIAVVCGYANSLMLLVLWFLQMSIVHVGQLFWSYGWETQLLETGFLAMFLVPLLDGRPFPRWKSSRIVIGLFCWLAARIMLGSGLIKLRGDPAWDWDQLTALYYHFETQPIPNGLSWFFHHLPKPVLQGGVVFNHVVELFVPFLLLLPRAFRNGAGAVMVLFQITLILSGNLSFLNYLTIVPCLACMDDRFYRWLLPKRWWARIREPEFNPAGGFKARSAVVLRIGLLILVALLSIRPVNNLLSPNQAMNTSFDPLHLVNTYGAFGSVGKTRYELIVEGTDHPNPGSPDAEWKAYEFHGKPGDPGRRPPWVAPYHLRLDWEIWFASFDMTKGEAWPVYFAVRLLEGEPSVKSLLRTNPFPDAPPTAIRIRRYVYRFTTPEERAGTGDWWVREFEENYTGVIALDDPQLEAFLNRFRWPAF